MMNQRPVGVVGPLLKIRVMGTDKSADTQGLFGGGAPSHGASGPR